MDEKNQLLAKFELAIEGSGFGVWELDLKSGKLVWDEKMHQIYGFELGSFDGSVEVWKSCLFTEDHDLVDNRFNELINGRRVELFEFRIHRKNDNEVRVIEANGIMRFDDQSQPLRVVGMNRDITERKKLSELLEEEKAARISAAKMASLGEMAGNIAHEINNPLAIISITAKKLKMHLEHEQPLSTDQMKESLTLIESTVMRISKIVKGMLKFSRDSSDEKFQMVELNQLADEVLAFIEEKVRHERVKIVRKSNAGEIWAQAASVQLSQVIINLINNSLDAIADLEEKWIEIQIRAATNTEGPKILITDSGRGIDAETQKHIMKPFFTSKPVGKGTGLGLTLSSAMIEKMGGRLTYESDSKNTQFSIRLSQASSNSAEL